MLKDANADFKSRSSEIFDDLANVKQNFSSGNDGDDHKFKMPEPVDERPVDRCGLKRDDRKPCTPRCPYKKFTKYSLACVDSEKQYSGLSGDSLNSKVASDFLADLSARKLEKGSGFVTKTVNTEGNRLQTSNGKITSPAYNFTSKSSSKRKPAKILRADNHVRDDSDVVSAKMSNTQISLSHLQDDSDEETCS